MVKKCDLSNHSFESAGKSGLADVICYCKITSVMALDVVTMFLRLKDVTNTSKGMQHSPNYWWEFFSAMVKVRRS